MAASSRVPSLLFWLILPATLAAADLNWNLGLASFLGRGEQQGVPYDYTENYFSLNLDAAAHSLQLEMEYSDPPEYGFAFTGLRRIWYQYATRDLMLELGDIGAVFGRGLALNLYEDQTIDFDNIPRGARLTWYASGEISLDLVAGRRAEYSFYSPSSSLREPDGLSSYDLAGVQLSYNAPTGAWAASPYALVGRLQSDYVWRELDPVTTRLEANTVEQEQRTLQLGWAQSVYMSNWDLFMDVNILERGLDYPLVDQEIKTTADGLELITSDYDHRLQGHGAYFQFNWFPQWFTAMFEYKRYAYGRELSADKRNPDIQASKPLPWIMGPTGIRQHDISLLGNVTHPVDYGDEVGWNLELRKFIGTDWALTLNATQVSQLSALGDPGLDAAFWPTTDLMYSPWLEGFMELEYTGGNLSNRMLLAYTRSVLSAEDVAEELSHVTVVPAYLSWHPSSDLNFSTVVELQFSVRTPREYAGGNEESTAFKSTHFIASADVQRNYSLSVIWDTSDDPTLAVGESAESLQHWVSAELSMRPTDKVWLRTSYGKEKGGVRCTGGVCRVINPFEGFRMTLEWRL